MGQPTVSTFKAVDFGLLWRLKHQDFTKRLYLRTKQNGIMFQDTFNIILHVSVRFWFWYYFVPDRIFRILITYHTNLNRFRCRRNGLMLLELSYDKFGAEGTQCCSARKKKAATAITSVKQSSYWKTDCRLAGQETEIISKLFLGLYDLASW